MKIFKEEREPILVKVMGIWKSLYYAFFIERSSRSHALGAKSSGALPKKIVIIMEFP